jgi:rsbT co-antagonist protein RsbR
MQREYFLGLTQGNYDTVYVEDRLRIGEVHERIGLPIKS